MDAGYLYRVGQEHRYRKRLLGLVHQISQRFRRIFLSFASGKYVFNQVVWAGAFLFGSELSYGPE